MITRRSASPGTSTPSQKLIVATSTACRSARKRQQRPFGASPARASEPAAPRAPAARADRRGAREPDGRAAARAFMARIDVQSTNAPPPVMPRSSADAIGGALDERGVGRLGEIARRVEERGGRCSRRATDLELVDRHAASSSSRPIRERRKRNFAPAEPPGVSVALVSTTAPIRSNTCSRSMIPEIDRRRAERDGRGRAPRPR